VIDDVVAVGEPGRAATDRRRTLACGRRRQSTSPVSGGAPGSTHGYDIIDHNRLES